LPTVEAEVIARDSRLARADGSTIVPFSNTEFLAGPTAPPAVAAARVQGPRSPADCFNGHVSRTSLAPRHAAHGNITGFRPPVPLDRLRVSTRTTEQFKVVARYADGRVLKGTTSNFSTERSTFAMHLAGPSSTGPLEHVSVSDLKALFFVRDFDGDPRRQDRRDFVNQPLRRAVAVTFFDGEVLVGASWTHESARDGFFLFPADPQSNNLRVYVVSASVASIEKLAPRSTTAPSLA
jgi:hypothetical protein